MEPLFVAIILYLLALLLLVIDLFIPTGGILLIASGLAAIAAIVFGFKAGINTGLVVLLIVLGTIPAVLWIFLKVWPHTPIGRRMLLEPSPQPSNSERDELQNLIGTVVVARWALLPTGQIQIGHRRYNSMSQDGRTIEANKRVKVIAIHERMLVVNETNESLTVVGSAPTQRTVADQPAAADPTEIPAEQLGLNSLEELPLDEAD